MMFIVEEKLFYDVTTARPASHILARQPLLPGSPQRVSNAHLPSDPQRAGLCWPLGPEGVCPLSGVGHAPAPLFYRIP